MIKWMGGMILSLTLQPIAVMAAPSAQAYLDLKKTDDKGAEWQLDVRQTPLAEALNVIARQSNLTIHFSVLPKELVTTHCIGSAIHQVLRCLLDRKADFVVRHNPNNNKAEETGQITEVWVLGTKYEGYPFGCKNCVLSKSGANVTDKQLHIGQEKLQALLNMTSSDKPSERAKAMGGLLDAGRNGDLEIRKTLEKGLHDEDASVRLQAVSTLTHRSDIAKEDQLTVIREAMQDDINEVRLTAVDGITDDVDLLIRATNDEDELVRSLAKAKLDMLNASSAQKPAP